MKVLLVRPKFSSIIANLEPLGLEYIGGMLKEIGVEYCIHDEFQYSGLLRVQRLKKAVKNQGYTCVGFNANANTTDYIMDTARELKKLFPSLFIMVGGPEAELNYRDFMIDAIDLVYHDNGLTSMKQAFENGLDPAVLSQLTGICFKQNGQWVVKEKGAPVDGFICQPDRTPLYKHIKKNFIFCKGSFAIAKASFCCPFKCSFCYCTKMNSGVYTERSLTDVLDEIEGIQHDKIWFVDDTFFIDRKRVEAFCHAVLERGIKKQFMAYSRADFMAENPDILPLVYQAGFRDILVGLEAVDDRYLDDYNKQTTKKMNEDAVKHLRESGIACNALFVADHRWGREDFKTLMRFIRENQLLWVVFGIFTPYKGTDAYEENKEHLIKFRSKRLDGLHITLKPEKMSSFMFMLRIYLLYLKTYPKIIFRTWMGTTYDTKKFGWL